MTRTYRVVRHWARAIAMNTRRAPRKGAIAGLTRSHFLTIHDIVLPLIVILL